ncbi:hypothetical protein C8R45DRAFT_935635 [Mycena sanguinolenta]|nr:hypothetical protein C8R45DRAFT_935635 [Mycena sanguinolenta]
MQISASSITGTLCGMSSSSRATKSGLMSYQSSKAPCEERRVETVLSAAASSSIPRTYELIGYGGDARRQSFEHYSDNDLERKGRNIPVVHNVDPTTLSFGWAFVRRG